MSYDQEQTPSLSPLDNVTEDVEAQSLSDYDEEEPHMGTKPDVADNTTSMSGQRHSSGEVEEKVSTGTGMEKPSILSSNAIEPDIFISAPIATEDVGTDTDAHTDSQCLVEPDSEPDSDDTIPRVRTPRVEYNGIECSNANNETSPSSQMLQREDEVAEETGTMADMLESESDDEDSKASTFMPGRFGFGRQQQSSVFMPSTTADPTPTDKLGVSPATTAGRIFSSSRPATEALPKLQRPATTDDHSSQYSGSETRAFYENECDPEHSSHLFSEDLYMPPPPNRNELRTLDHTYDDDLKRAIADLKRSIGVVAYQAGTSWGAQKLFRFFAWVTGWPFGRG
jgi:hypothetical protein